MDKTAFADRVLESAAGTFRIFSIHLGHRLGYYRTLRADGPLAAHELAARAGTSPRYAREWLEQQVVAGILVHEPGEPPRFALPAAHAAVLADEDDLDYLAPLAQLIVGATRPLDQVEEAHRTGGGVAYAAFGAHLREGQAAMNRAMFLQLIGKEWIPAMPDVDARLRGGASARIADVGCGVGWSSIGLALAYPRARVDGLDLDAPSIAEARRNAEAAGVADRVAFHVRDAAEPGLEGTYDLVTAFECVHDLSRPVDVLAAMRRLLKPGGSVLVVDERVGERFDPQGEGFEWMMYGWSILHCLPVGLADTPSAATGAVMRPPTLRRYAEHAGFSRMETLPVAHPFFRLYRLAA